MDAPGDPAIESVLASVSRLESGGSRKPEDALEGLARATRSDPGRRAALEEGLAGVLESRESTLAGRDLACKLLWRIGTDRSLPALARLLAAEETAEMACYALEGNRSDAAGSALREALGSAARGGGEGAGEAPPSGDRPPRGARGPGGRRTDRGAGAVAGGGAGRPEGGGRGAGEDRRPPGGPGSAH